MKLLSAPFLPLLTSALLIATLSGCGKSPEQHYLEAKTQFDNNNLKTAILELKSTLQAQPEHREARLLLGKAYLASEEYAGAEKELSKAREQGASNDEALPALAKALLKQNQTQKMLALTIPSDSLSPGSIALLQVMRAEALFSLNRAEEANLALALAEKSDAKQPDLLLLKARLAVGNKELAQAHQLADAALSGNPKFLDGHYFKAGLLATEGKPDEAVQAYGKVLAIDPRAYRAHLAISDIQLLRGQKEAGEKALHAAESIAPNMPLVKYARGIYELRGNNFKAANDALMQFLRFAPDYPPAQLASALANLGLGNFEQSLKSAQSVLAKQPDNLLAARVVAASQLKSGDIKEALATIEPLLKTRSDDAQLLSLAGEAYFQSKDYKRSLSALNQAESIAPSDAVINNRQAAVLLAIGQTDQALAELKHAASLSEKAGQVDVALITLSLQRKEFDKALQAVDALEKKQPNSAVTHHLRAVVLIVKNDLAGARKSLEKAITLAPKYYPAVANLARLDLAANQINAAIKRLDDLLAKDPDNLQAMLARAELALLNKQEQEYVSWLEKASKAHPKALQPRALLSRYYLVKKDNTHALTAARDAIKSNPEDLQALNLLGVTQMAARDAKAGVDTYRQLVQKVPNSADAHLRLGLALSAAENFKEARNSLINALKISPDLVDAMDANVRLELREKNYEAAMQWAKKIQASQPKSPLGYDREGDILMAQRRFEAASKAYQLAQDQAPSTQGVIKLHSALSSTGAIKAAQGKLDSWVSSHATDLVARIYYAGKAAIAGEDKVAVAQYEEILRQQPGNAIALNNLAGLYQKNKDPRALKLAERGVQSYPDNAALQDTLGWILVEQGHIKKGLDLLAKAAAQASRYPTIQYHYAVALARDGNKAKAKELLQATLITQPKFPEADAAKSLLESLK